MNKKGFASLMMASVMTAGMLAGCSGGNNKQSAGTDTPAASSNQSEGFADYSQGFKEKVAIDIPVYERAFEGWNVSDNYYTRWVQAEFGDKYNIDVNFVPISRSSEVTDYEQLLASHKAPDIIFHYDMPQALTYYGEDVMQELDYSEIENYAPTYWANLGETIQQYGKVDDKNTFFFAARPEADNFVSIIRKDWVEQVGMKVEDLTSWRSIMRCWRNGKKPDLV